MNESRDCKQIDNPRKFITFKNLIKETDREKYYSKFKRKDDIFKIGDFVEIETSDEVNSVGRIRSIYYDLKEEVTNYQHRVIIEKFYSRRNVICNDLFPDIDIIQLENLSQLDIPISLLVKKCQAKFATVNDDPRSFQNIHKGLDIVYVCRYWYAEKGSLYPLNSDRFPIQTQDTSDIVVISDSEDETETILDEYEQLDDNSSKVKKIETEEKNEENDKVNDSSMSVEQSEENCDRYKVSFIDSDNSIKLTLKKLPAHFSPTVLLERLDLNSDIESTSHLEKSRVKNNMETPRRSTRSLAKINYEELNDLKFSIARDKIKSTRIHKLSSSSESDPNYLEHNASSNNKIKSMNKTALSSRGKKRESENDTKLSTSEDEIKVRKSNRVKRSLEDDLCELRLSPRKRKGGSNDDSFRKSQRKPTSNSRRKRDDSDSESEITISPKKQTHSRYFDDDDDNFGHSGKGKRTPGLRLKNLTPRVQHRTYAIKLSEDPFEQARRLLSNWSRIGDGSLPCREQEYSDIFQFVYKKLVDDSGGCMYISGVPGTGKTATVCAVMEELSQMKKLGDIDEFDFVKVNALSLTEPRQVYVQLVKQISGKILQWQLALDYLIAYFTKTKKSKLVLLIDELDRLWTKKQDVVYNLLDLPSKSKTPLVILTIANTMDLPERLLSNKVNSRLGLTRLTFKPYKYTQLSEIVKARLTENNCVQVFRDEAVELVARKVAAISGDARRVLDICARAVEIAAAGSADIVDIKIVNSALQEMIATPTMRAITSCTKLERSILMAISNEMSRTGNEEVPFTNMMHCLISVLALDSMPLPSVQIILAACNRLAAFRLLIKQHGRTSIESSLILNVSPDELNFSL